MGIAVSSRIGPLPYAVAAASPASTSPTVAAGADEAMPMTVSCATPIASGSSRVAGAGIFPATAAADELATVIPHSRLSLPASIVVIPMAKSPGLFFVICERSWRPHGGRVPNFIRIPANSGYAPQASDRLAAADLFICWVRKQVTLQP